MTTPLAPALAGDATIGDRLARIDQMFTAIRGDAPAAPQTSFASALASATAPAASTSPVAGGTPFGAEINAAAARYGIDPALLTGLIRQESGFNPAARSGAGAVGLTQLMPGTATSLGVTNPLDPAQSIDGGARYLRQQLDRFGGDPSKALAAYNAGPGAVQRFGGVPPYAETQNYVQRVLAYAAQARGGTTATPTPTPTASA
jgi:soluble lytic murein transglycosylase-like protein